MPESMFGRPSQHLLPHNPPANAGATPATSGSETAPVQPTPPTFRDFRFNSIGKQPELLSRISVPQPEDFSYHSPSPSPISTPPPATDDDVFPSKSSSRPTLLQQLSGWDFNDAGGSSSHASHNQMNGSLAARIQMDTNSANSDLSGGFLPHLSHFDGVWGTTENAIIGHSNLIPPIEFLAPGSDSTAPTPPTPASSIPQPAHSHGSESFNPLIGANNSGTGTRPVNSSLRRNTDVNASTSASHPAPVTTFSRSIHASTANSLPPPISATASSRTFPETSTSISVPDAIMRDLPQPSPATVVTVDSLVDRQARLTAIKAKLANLALPPPPPLALSASPVPSTISRTNENVGPAGHSQPQQDSGPIALHPSPVDNRQSDRPSSSSNGVSMDTEGNALALVTPSSTLSHEYQTQRKAIVEAASSLNTAFNTAYRAQIDSEVALTARMQALENERAAFEEKKRADELALQNQLREIQQKREELSAKEVSLVATEKESKARELARRAMLEKRQALEEERRTANEKRGQEVQEQIATALKELEELEALREERQRLQQGIDSTPDLQLIEPEEGMSAEEGAVIKSRNGLVPAIKHHFQLHTEKLRKFEELDRTVRRLAEERKKREAEEAAEAERRRAEEDRLRAHAEAERARQVVEQERREREEAEAEKRRREAAKLDEHRGSEEGRVAVGRARLLVEHQALAEAQAHGVRQAVTVSQEVEQRRQQGVSPSQQQYVAEASRIRAARQENSLAPPEPSDAMDVDEADRAVSPNLTVRSPTIHTAKGRLQKTPPKSKSKEKPMSGGVMLSVSSRADGAHLPPKLMATPLPAQSSSDVATGGSSNVGRAPPSPPSTDSGDAETFTFPAQLASEFNQLAGAVNGAKAGTHRPSTPEQKPLFWAPKSQTLLEAGVLGVGNGASQPLNIGPRLVVSPTQRGANLRHLKRARGRTEGNEGGDRSVRISSVKSEDAAPPFKREERDDQSRELVQASSANPPASLLPRPHVIPPPRPRQRHRKRRDGDPSQPASSQPSANSETHDLPFTGEVITEAQFGNVSPQVSPNSQVVVSAQLPVPPMNSLLFAPVHFEPQSTESNSRAHERLAQDRVAVPETASPETISTTFPHETEGQDLSRNNRRSSDEHRPGRNGNNIRRQHYFAQYGSSHPTVPSPPYRPGGDSRRPSNAADAPRAEPMRASSPTTGRKRPSDSSENENPHRSRRQRPDVWIADDHDRERRGDTYRPRERRSLNTEPDERRSSHRTPPSPDRSRVYLPETQRGYDRYVASSSDVSMVPPARYEQSYRRPETEEPRHQPAPPPTITSHYPMTEPYWAIYDPPADRMDVHQDPSLLARISDTQRFPISAHSRGRGRGDPSRGRGDPARGRGRGNGRGGAGLLERLTSGPSSLEDRLT